MISQKLYSLADFCAGHAVRRRTLELEHLASMASVLMDLAERASWLEDQPILAGRPDVGPPAERDDG